MRAAIFHGPGDIRTETVKDPSIKHATDAVVKVTRSCICGSDLWYYRGISEFPVGARIGHEFIGVIESVGADVQSVKPGDLVVAPWAFSCGRCEFCQVGLFTSCVRGGYWGKTNDGGQAEAVRVPFADGTLVRLPDETREDSRMATAMLALSDVMGTGHHANVLAETSPKKTTVVIGDGAVGLCAVLAAKRLGSERIIAVGRHSERLKVAEYFGATDLVLDQGQDVAAEVQQLTKGGAASVCECVGTQSALDLAIAAARPGGSIGLVGVPHFDKGVEVGRLMGDNIALRFGVAPVRNYISELALDIVSGKIDPSPVFDQEIRLEQIADGYSAMSERRAIKTLISF